MAKAFFLVGGPDVRGETAVNLAEWDVLVCSTSLNPDDVRRVAKPGATLYGYINTRAVSLSGPDNAVMQSMRAAMGVSVSGNLENDDKWSWYVHEHPATTALIRDPKYPNLVLLRHNLDAAEAYAEWIAENMGGWDGVYLDDCFEALPERYWSILDGAHQWRPPNRWPYYRDYLCELLQARGRTLVGNIGRTFHNFPPYLDSICIESTHGTGYELANALGAFWAKTQRPNHSIIWDAGDDVAEVPGVICKGVAR